MKKANQRIRLRMKNKGVHVWQLADAMGISENTLFRRLRHQLDEKEVTRICLLIDKVAEEDTRE